MIQALIFDLDDTLYPESDFLTSGYRVVARYVADNYAYSFDQIHSLFQLPQILQHMS
jgi:putative hydrolase of the HAD superfamily